MKKEQGMRTKYKSSARIKNTTAGITLIALVITIIVLLILAGVSISLVVGENGVLNQATQAVEANNQAEEEEKVKLAAAASIDTKDLKVKKTLLEKELDNLFGNGKYDLTEETDYYLITIKSSGRKYKIDSYGNVTAINSSEDEAEDSEGPTSITIEGERTLSFSIYGETTTTLYACDQNGNRIESSAIVWTSSDYSIASVIDGSDYGENGGAIVDVWSPGTATIRATYADDSNIYDEITIIVKDTEDDTGFVQKPEKITILGDTYLDYYSELVLHAVDGSGAAIDEDSIEWSSSNSDIAGVYDTPGYGEGARAVVYSGPSGGTVTIRATSTYDSSIYGEITIAVYNETIPTSITIKGNDYIDIADDSEMTLYACDQNGNRIVGEEVIWTSSDTSIAEMYGYDAMGGVVINAYYMGTVTIRATSAYNSEIYDEITITVRHSQYMECPSSISIGITSGSAEMSVGDRLLFRAYDENEILLSEWDIEVYSDDESIATAGMVEHLDAYVDAISPGTVDIIVKSYENPTVYQTLTVTVKE